MAGRRGTVAWQPRSTPISDFDDDVVRGGAEADPIGFVASLHERVVLDEVQRVPEFFAALKLAIDRRRVPGRFVLTGSSIALRVPTLADSLTGRLQIVRLHPVAQSELAAGPAGAAVPDPMPRFLDTLFHGRFPSRQTKSLGGQLGERIVAGGFPADLALAGVEAKALGTLTGADFPGLRRLRRAVRDRFAAGVVVFGLKTGATVSFIREVSRIADGSWKEGQTLENLLG